MNSVLLRLINVIKNELEKDSSRIVIAKINNGTDNVDSNINLIVPCYADFLNVCNGVRCGCIDLFDATCILNNQYDVNYIEGGKKKWFCIGQVLYQPLVVNLDTKDIFLFFNSYFYEGYSDENGWVVLGKLETFLMDYVFGKKYLELTPDAENDRWSQFLKEINLI